MVCSYNELSSCNVCHVIHRWLIELDIPSSLLSELQHKKTVIALRTSRETVDDVSTKVKHLDYEPCTVNSLLVGTVLGILKPCHSSSLHLLNIFCHMNTW